MKVKSICLILSAFFATVLFSCKPNASEKIVGNWIPLGPSGEKMTDMRIKFLANKIGVAEEKSRPPAPRDSITYEIKNDGKLLVTTERSGRVEEMNIVELSDKNLVLTSTKRSDTVRLVRE